MVHFVLAGISVLCLGYYYVLLKSFSKNSLHIMFWIHAINYVLLSLVTFIGVAHKNGTVSAITTVIKDTTLINLPLYLLSGAVTLASMIIFRTLIKKFDVGMVLGMSQMSVVFSVLVYKGLGDHVTTGTIVGASLVLLGALVSGFPQFNFKKPLSMITSISPQLFWGSLGSAILATIISTITFICTARFNFAAQAILHTLTHHLHIIPFTALSPIQFNIGAQASILFALYIYLHHINKEELLGRVLKSHTSGIIKTAIVYGIFLLSYYTAFDMIPNKSMLGSLSKLYLPVTLILSHILLHEKVNKPKIVGTGIIIFGGFVTVLMSLL